MISQILNQRKSKNNKAKECGQLKKSMPMNVTKYTKNSIKFALLKLFFEHAP